MLVLMLSIVTMVTLVTGTNNFDFFFLAEEQFKMWNTTSFTRNTIEKFGEPTWVQFSFNNLQTLL